METISTIAIVIGLTEVVKKLGLPVKLVPVFALVLGMGISMLVGGVNTTSILAGLVLGLTSQGLYAGTKATLGM